MSQPDRFAIVMGVGRGQAAPVLASRLAQVERALAEAQEDLRLAEQNADALRARLQDADDELVFAEEHAERLTVDGARVRWQRDHARYAAACGGIAVGFGCDEVHHGVWTPGRPYVAGDHVLHPETGRCYRVDYWRVAKVAPLVARPGVARLWRECQTNDCPRVPKLPPRRPHPFLTGHALRQSDWWWDATGRRLALGELSREGLLDALDWLSRNALHFYREEVTSLDGRFPCPVVAYADPWSWLHDTPVWRALQEEKRRRRIRRRSAPAIESAPQLLLGISRGPLAAHATFRTSTRRARRAALP